MLNQSRTEHQVSSKATINTLNDVLIYSGSAHPGLAKAIATYLGLNLSTTHIQKFSNDNYYIQLGSSVRGKQVFIIQPLSPPCSDNLMELLLMLDIARSGAAKDVCAVIPYFSYARSDKKDAPRISIAARLVADLLVTAGASQVITMTLHSAQGHGFFSVPTDHLTAHSVFVEHFSTRDLSNTVVLAPDIGHAKRAGKLARSLGLAMAAGEKARLSDNTVAVRGIMGDVTGKNIILVDDEIATAGTISEVIKYLQANHQVTRVTVVGTHGLFTGSAVSRLNAIEAIDEIVVTDTVPLPKNRRPDRLKVLSVARIFGEVIRCNVEGISVGSLFEFWPLPTKLRNDE
ncbi:MAG: ribose-phosphate diphosphokinase [Anaerolineae bacterium]|nr:ribose-phosphate diphosphokinase [Anaerolineae bacterium]